MEGRWQFHFRPLDARVHRYSVTDDGSGAYNTSGVLLQGRLQGLTHSLGREFLAVWSAERK